MSVKLRPCLLASPTSQAICRSVCIVWSLICLYCGSLGWGTVCAPLCFAVWRRERLKFALLMCPFSTRPGTLMLESSITATSSEGTLGWPTPTATATITTMITSVAPKRIAMFRFEKNPRFTGAAA